MPFSRAGLLNCPDKLGRTPILLAVEQGSLGCLMALLRFPEVDMETKDKRGRSLEEVARWVKDWGSV